MNRKPSRWSGAQRKCAFCGHGISEARPVFLVASGKGTLAGPYHAGCCDKLVAAHKGIRADQLPLSEEFGRLVERVREEGEPW